MSILFQATKNAILKRQALDKVLFCDKHILAAIEAYDSEASSFAQTKAFMRALDPLWRDFGKQSYVNILDRFADMEVGLEAYSPSHSSHALHVLEEFLFGFNVLTTCEVLGPRTGMGSPTDFRDLFFTWMAAALSHDVGYDIERYAEEEAFRAQKNAFWDFMTPRSMSTAPVTFAPDAGAHRALETYLLKDLRTFIPTFGAPGDIDKLCLRRMPPPAKVKYDHGVISAIKYLLELEKLSTPGEDDYLTWAPNRRAALAMAVHNVRYTEFNPGLSFKDPQATVAYLLIVCDEAQEWQRGRLLFESTAHGRASVAGKVPKNVELVGVAFDASAACVTVNHRAKDVSLTSKMEQELFTKIEDLKATYPIAISGSPVFSDARDHLVSEMVSGIRRALKSTAFLHRKRRVPRAETTRHDRLLARLEKVASLQKTISKRNLLVASTPDPVYRVIVDHRIDGEPCITVSFLF